MSTEQCWELTERAIEKTIEQLNNGDFGTPNEATLQHHLALNMHLDALGEDRPSISMVLEKKVVRAGGNFPKKNRPSANIDIFFVQDDDTRCAIEIKCFHRANQREPNNRYDAYADIANLEAYLGAHADVGVFVLFTDHPHYYDTNFVAHQVSTGDFCLRQDHIYRAGYELSYRTAKPYGRPITLVNDYPFEWRNSAQSWRVLVLKVE